MKTKAAILVQTGQALCLEDIEIPSLKDGQVLVEIQYSGVCYTQVSETRGHRGKDQFLPHCLGHEGSGVVLQTSPGVTKVNPGDRVLLSWMRGQGCDVPGSIYKSDRGAINAGGITTFSRHSVVSENRLMRLPAEISFREAALLGCAVPTGMGAVFNTAQAKPGQSAVVFGVGGVGMCALSAALIAGCSPVVAIDVNAQRLETAKVLGASACILVNGNDVVADLRHLSKNGFDFAVEASGRPQAMKQALEAVRNQGGIAVVLGNARFGEMLEIDPRQLNLGKQLRGSWGGDNDPERDFPRYFDYLTAGKLDLTALTSRSYSLNEVNQALSDLESGTTIRPLLEMSLP